MRRSIILLALLALLGMPTALSAQDLFGPPLRTWVLFGCNPDFSCHRTTVNVTAYNPYTNQPLGNVLFQHWYYVPGMVRTSVFDPVTGGLDLDFETNANTYDWYFEEILPLTATTGGWVPRSVTHYVGYGTNPGDLWGEGTIGETQIVSHLTPEPASLLLVATGMGVLLAAKPRRKGDPK